MVALTGELGEPPERIARPVAPRRAARDRARRRRARPRRADHVHRDPPLGALPRAPAGAGRGGRDDRRGADPEPRHDRRQHRQRLAGRRHAAGPAGARRRVRLRLGARRARRAGERVLAGLPRDGAGPGRAAAADPDPAGGRSRDALPQGRHAPGPVDQQGRDGPRLARRRSRGGPWTDVRLALGSVAPDADPRRARPRPSSRAGRRRRRPPTAPPRRWPASSSRSTTSARPPSTGALVAARVLHRLIREAGGW